MSVSPFGVVVVVCAGYGAVTPRSKTNVAFASCRCALRLTHPKDFKTNGNAVADCGGVHAIFAAPRVVSADAIKA